MSFLQPKRTYIAKRFLRRPRSRSRSVGKRKRSTSRSRAFSIRQVAESSTPSKFKKLDKRIPQPIAGGFRLLVQGASGSGKTILVIRLLQEYMKFFESVHIVSPAPFQFERNLRLRPSDELIRTLDEKKLMYLYERHKKLNRETRRKNHMIFVFDDLVLFLNDSKVFKNMLLNGRKHGISFIITTQRYAQSSQIIKMNMSDIVLMTGTEQDVNNISKIYGLSPKLLLSLYRKYVLPKRYSFLRIRAVPLSIFFEFRRTRLYPRPSSRKRSKSKRSRSKRSRKREKRSRRRRRKRRR